jgi:hypothetical protein
LIENGGVTHNFENGHDQIGSSNQDENMIRSLKVDVTGRPRINPVTIPSTMKGGKPGENGGVTHNFENGPPKDHFNSNF